MGKIFVAYLTKTTKFCPALQLSLLHGSWQKSARASSDTVLKVIPISSKSVLYFSGVEMRMREHRQHAPKTESNIRRKPSFEVKKNTE